MILGYETIINKIITATSLPRQEIEAKIEQKLKDLQDLILELKEMMWLQVL